MADSINRDKARRAAAHAKRPGALCKAPPGAFRPVVERHKCEGKGDCVEVCPYHVFEVGPMQPADFAKLSALGKLKSLVHGRKTAYTPLENACQACGLCVVACPENAIALRAHGPTPAST